MAQIPYVHEVQWILSQSATYRILSHPNHSEVSGVVHRFHSFVHKSPEESFGLSHSESPNACQITKFQAVYLFFVTDLKIFPRRPSLYLAESIGLSYICPHI